MEVTATKFVRSFAQYRDQAFKGPVIVKNHDRVVGVYLSADDYARLRLGSRQAYRAGELPEDARAALDEAVYPSDDELKSLGL